MRVKELVCEHVDVLVSANVRAYACACARAGICKCASVDTRAHTKVLRRKRGHSQLRLGVFAPHAERERVRRRASHGKRERLGRRTGKLKKAQESDGTSRKCKGLLTSRTPSDSKKSLAVHENSRKLMKVLGTSRTLMVKIHTSLVAVTAAQESERSQPRRVVESGVRVSSCSSSKGKGGQVPARRRPRGRVGAGGSKRTSLCTFGGLVRCPQEQH